MPAARNHLVRAAARDPHRLVLVLLHMPHVHAVRLPRQQRPVLCRQHEALRQGRRMGGIRSGGRIAVQQTFLAIKKNGTGAAPAHNQDPEQPTWSCITSCTSAGVSTRPLCTKGGQPSILPAGGQTGEASHAVAHETSLLSAWLVTLRMPNARAGRYLPAWAQPNVPAPSLPAPHPPAQRRGASQTCWEHKHLQPCGPHQHRNLAQIEQQIAAQARSLTCQCISQEAAQRGPVLAPHQVPHSA